MRYFKRLRVWKASNVEVNTDECIATSYGWWQFVKKVNGLVIFNSYRYSPSTSKHQYKVRCLLSKLNIKVDLFIEAPRGLQNLSDAIRFYEVKNDLLREAMLKPRTHKQKNVERLEEMKQNSKLISQIKTLEV